MTTREDAAPTYRNGAGTAHQHLPRPLLSEGLAKLKSLKTGQSLLLGNVMTVEFLGVLPEPPGASGGSGHSRPQAKSSSGSSRLYAFAVYLGGRRFEVQKGTPEFIELHKTLSAADLRVVSSEQAPGIKPALNARDTASRGKALAIYLQVLRHEYIN